MTYILIATLILLLIIIILLIFKNKTIVSDEKAKQEKELQQIQKDIDSLLQDEYYFKQSVQEYEKKYNDLKSNYEAINSQYQNKIVESSALDNEITLKRDLIDNELTKLKESRVNELELTYLAKENELKNNYEIQEQIFNKKIQNLQCAEKQYEENIAEALNKVTWTYNALAEAIKKAELERDEQKFYTVNIPEEYQKDILYLSTEVIEKIQHQDIINKLLWSEYIKPNLDETFKRLNIESESGIYKLTSTIDNKSYIGKSTNIKKRISDHFKGALGITTIADQEIHHVMRKQGINNWMIEVLEICDKDKLNYKEKYYIELLQTNKIGYNMNKGGGG